LNHDQKATNPCPIRAKRLLGVQDDGTLQGIEPDAVTQIKKDFVTSINNPLKLTPPTYLSLDVIELDGKSLLRIYVPESSQVHRCNGRIYDRNEDGDLDITDHTTQVAHLYQRKQATFSENKVFSYAQDDDVAQKFLISLNKASDYNGFTNYTSRHCVTLPTGSFADTSRLTCIRLTSVVYLRYRRCRIFAMQTFHNE